MKRKTVAVVDYGSGNLRSVSQAVQHVARAADVEVLVTSSAQQVLDADRVVLPGQGHMGDCMRELAASGLQAAVLHAALTKQQKNLLPCPISLSYFRVRVPSPSACWPNWRRSSR